MNKNLLILLVITPLLLLFPGICQGQCPEDPTDLGNCDTLHVLPWPGTDYTYAGQSEPFPCILHVDLLVTHDSNSFWYDTWSGDWVQDSIAAFGIPLYWTHTNQTAYCSLTSVEAWWGPYYHISGDSCWYHFNGPDSMFVPPHSWIAFVGDGREKRWGEGSRFQLVRLNFEIQDTMHLFIDTTFWPPELSLQFVRYDGAEYKPRHNLPVSIWVNPGSIAGNVQDASTLQPVEDVSVWAIKGADWIHGRSTEEDGNYNIPNLLPGFYNVRARKTGYETKTYNGVQVTGGQITSQNFNLNPSPADTVFFDSFWDGNYDGWDTVTKACDWMVDGIGRFVITAPGEQRVWCIASAGDPNWTDYIYEADVFGVQGVDKIIAFRFVDQNNFYAVNLRSDWGIDADSVTLNKMQGGEFTADIVTEYYPSQNGTEYHLKVEVSGTVETNIKVWIDDNKVLDWTDTGAPITQGKIAVAAWSGDFGWVYGIPTIVSFDDILVADLTERQVGTITLKADHFEDLGGGNIKAEGNVWIGDQTGGNQYLYLGAEAEVTYNANSGTISSVLYTDVKLSAKEEAYVIDNLSSFEIDAQAGRVNLEGRVHYGTDAIFQSSFSGTCTLAVNQREFYGRIQFDDVYFAPMGIHRATWDLDGCPFMGFHHEINLTASIGLTDLTVIDGEITVGVFPNTGIFRVGMTNGALEFKESGGAFGFDLTGLLTPPGFPSQGMIDIDLAHLRVNVVKDIPIGLWKFTKEDSSEVSLSELNSKTLRADWSSLRKIDQNTYVMDVYDTEGNKYQKFLFDVGLTIKGEEHYDDINCNGVYDPGIDTFIPYDPDYDFDLDGQWDEGTNIALLDESQNPIFDAHGDATLDLTLASYVHFTCAEAVLDIDYPNRNTIELEIWTGLKLGNIFTLDLATGVLSLDFQNREYSAYATLGHPQFTGATFSGQLLVAFDPFEFQVAIDQDFQLLGVDIHSSGMFLRVDELRLYLDAYLNAFTLLDANGRFIWKWDPWAVDGSFNSDFHIDGWHLAQLTNTFHFAPSQCMSGAGTVKLCVWKLCKGVPFSYRICSFLDWSVSMGGISIGLGSPANLHIYDSQGRHTGINPEGGIDTEIPGSEFYVFEDIGQQLAFLPDPDLVGGYTIDVEGLADSVFDFNILYPNRADGNAYNVGYFEEITQEDALHRVNLDVNNNWTMLNDLDGDSIFESQTEPDSTAEAILDTTMVTITNVSSEILCANEVNVTWNTNVPATSEVFYRSEYDSVYKSVSDTTLTTSHSVLVDSILTTDTYYYIVVSVDTSGNIACFLEKSFKLDYVVGDVNTDGIIDLGDIVYLINYLFKGGPAPDPIESGDCNCDEIVDLGDLVYLINYLYKQGPPPCK
ncbi:MAG: carboxypeptidase regulatory-like domain-containing protein [candidate division Zixibacteria bacterium]|nr:carboxypeptidase regulatory-like domain-containing protein [candidate division Zixibacteria bacterium]